jgi:hypothetical protein
VIKAARIPSAASGGQILMSNVMHGTLGYSSDLGFGDAVEVLLTSLEGVHTLVPLEFTSRPDSRFQAG